MIYLVPVSLCLCSCIELNKFLLSPFSINSFIDAQKSQCSSLSDGESFECYGMSELVDNNGNGIAGEEEEEVPVANPLNRLSHSSMMTEGGRGAGNGMINQLSPVTSDSSSGDPELSINNSSNNGWVYTVLYLA